MRDDLGEVSFVEIAAADRATHEILRLERHFFVDPPTLLRRPSLRPFSSSLLDQLLSEQVAAAEEVGAIREWLKREGACLPLAPCHDVGFTEDLNQRDAGKTRVSARPNITTASNALEKHC